MTRIVAIVLAAGRSTRMGTENKLLLTFGDKTMVSHVIDQLLASDAVDVLVVTGNEDEKVRASIKQKVTFTHNEEYAEGLSTSVKTGIAALSPDVDGVMICLGDMPYILASDYNKLIAAFKTGKIIAPTADGKIGNPLLFSNKFFADFEALDGDKGAKSLLKKYQNDIIEVDVSTDAIFSDIDTPEEYDNI